MDTRAVRISVSKHAADRLRQRFQLRFFGYFDNYEMTKNLILGQVTNGIHLEGWKKNPEYFRRMLEEYGPSTEVFHKSGVFFICEYNKMTNSMLVKTCVEHMYSCEPELVAIKKAKMG